MYMFANIKCAVKHLELMQKRCSFPECELLHDYAWLMQAAVAASCLVGFTSANCSH